MKKKLEEELVSIAHRILKLKGRENLDALQSEAQKLYEKLTLLKYVEDHFGELQSTTGRSEVADKFEILANSVLKGNSDVPESNPNEHEDEIMTPVINTIRDIVQEMPEEETLDDILSGITPNPTFVKRDMDLVTPKVSNGNTAVAEKRARSLNEQLKGGFAIGLNDKLAFIKHLFNGSNEDYIRVISQINTMDSFEEAHGFITEMIKPDYENWEGKETYENRFLEIIEKKFS
ncbi:hypothetical protein [Galbibacter orientalis]|uniref:Uncharacterized protein n=1 Tax=Galbibacter orientalis DSM 19592 TaxID=926559 RepID=I3C3N2_9FLAO|nr:hypothetical protein [Galbibacter orientalis]EIJ38225.1 hypothetical protein JoomaDRAFT_1207 [Galbibacter orientalis DSM 19592]